MAPLDSYGGPGAGVQALSDSYLYTVEARADYYERLAPGAWLALTRWEKQPPRDGLKLFAMAIEMLRARGLEPGSRLALIRGWQTSTLLASDFHPVTVEITKLTYDVRRLAMALGYLGLILRFSHGTGGLAIRRALAAVGRMALTNYLAQSILCALIFYGFGLGLYGRITGFQLYGVVLAIWALQLAWSSWWLKRYQIGPFEWVWRSLTYRRRLGAKQELLHPVPEQGSTL